MSVPSEPEITLRNFNLKRNDTTSPLSFPSKKTGSRPGAVIMVKEKQVPALIPPFQVKNIYYLKMLLDSAYYVFGVPYTFRVAAHPGKGFRIVDSLLHRIICSILSISGTSILICTSWPLIHNVSSYKKDLTKGFDFIRQAIDVALYSSIAISMNKKRMDLKKLLEVVWPSVNPEELKWGTKQIWLGLGFATLYSFSIWIALTFPPSLLELGMYEAGKKGVDAVQGIISGELPFLSNIFPVEGSLARILAIYLFPILWGHVSLTLWLNILFNLSFVGFLRSNVVSFKQYLESLCERSGGHTDKLFEDYLTLKRISGCVNQYISPRFSFLVLGAIPHSSFFLATFSELADGQRVYLYIYVGWTVLVYSMFFIAANANKQVGELKNILMENKHKLGKFCKEPSDLTWMLNDLGNGNGLGMTCCDGSVIMDYPLLGLIISSSVTLGIILIQAKP